MFSLKRRIVPFVILLILGTPLAAQQPPRPLPVVLDDLEKLLTELRAIANPPTSPSSVITVPAGGDLQAAINKTVGGETILLQPGARYVGSFILPPRPSVVTIRTAGTLPNRRITPADAPQLAVLAAGGPQLAVDGTGGAANWTLDGVAFECRPDGLSECVAFQNAKNIAVDRVLLVGGVNGIRRGIRINGQQMTVTRSHIANVWRTGQDSQALCAWDGAGPYVIRDNYLEAASENVMFGGSDMATEAGFPSDITIEGNTFRKRAEWRGTGKAIKNLLEFKFGRRVVVRGNSFANNWTDAQSGWAILLKTVNQDGGNPWARLEDVLVEGNDLTDTDNGFNLSGYDYNKPSGRTTRITIHNNTVTVRGAAFQLQSELGDVTIDGNSITQGGNLMTLDKGGVWPAGGMLRAAAFAVETLVFTNNRSKDVPYGIKGGGAASGEPSLKAYAVTYTYTGNTYW